jgi:hypothetical protein
MTTDEHIRQSTDSKHTDRIGKVFVVVGQDVRRCAICEGVFTRKAAAEHADLLCSPQGLICNSTM